jgi:hypothetical protein
MPSGLAAQGGSLTRASPPAAAHARTGNMRGAVDVERPEIRRAYSAFGVDSVLPSRWCQPRSVIAAAQGVRAPAAAW